MTENLFAVMRLGGRVRTVEIAAWTKKDAQTAGAFIAERVHRVTWLDKNPFKDVF